MNTSSSLMTGIMIMLVISGLLTMVNLAVNNYNPDSTFGNNNMLDRYGNKDAGTLNSFNNDYLPESEDSVSPETGNVFTDMFRTAKSWILKTTGAQYVIDYLQAPIILLKSMNLPTQLIWIIGAMWYGVFVFLIVSWLLNR